MAQYKPFLIKLDKEGSLVKDSKEWNIWVKHIPFKIYSNAKDIPSRSWLDSDGDEEFVPTIIPLQAYEIECQFVYIGSEGSANENIVNFLDYISKNGSFSIYDTYSKVGKSNVRFVGFDEDVLYRKEGIDDVVVFSITLKVNNPRENIVLTK